MNVQSMHVRSAACSRCCRHAVVHQAEPRIAFRKSPITELKCRSQQTRTRALRGHNRRLTTMGLPIPIIGPLFNPFFATIAYAIGAARFWSNYDRTSFDSSQKTKLTALWPVLFIGSENFRKEFKKIVG